jgi:hypothetical protein
MMNAQQDLTAAMTEALQTTENAAAIGKQLSAGDLLRATIARRVSDAYERAVRDAKELADAAATLVETLQCEGIEARLSAHTFAAKARRVSGALIRLTERREVFEAVEAQRSVARLLTPAAGNGEGNVGLEGDGEEEEELTED